ncbi:MAG: exo-alpha-sialidase [Chloroflexi bacterium]|nr:exo-alpha-sialidase [Chloroflexota bacterium]MBT4513659.1 exo-alpha-sialidase [Chloroflexota bacterium]MBT6682673.1 exo-alpha-sialidase [Chloroflexota bacterium]
MADKIALFVGTNKGGFILTSDTSRQKWDVSGPHLRGYSIDHMAFDPRDGRTFMALNHEVYGPEVVSSPDFGESWIPSDAEARFTDGSNRKVEKLWNIQPGRPSEPGVIYLGGMPAALWKSEDSGKTWQENMPLQQHESRPLWNPGAGGLCLHTIVLDPTDVNRMAVGISAAGYWVTEDDGTSWERRSDNLPSDPPPEEMLELMGIVDHDPDQDKCVHKVAVDANDPAVQYIQHHTGVFRTLDHGRVWEEISKGLPEQFGFPIVSHPRKSGHIWVIPNSSGEFRTSSSGAFRVFKSETGGDDWRALTKGLPQENAYFSTLRESMAVDGADPLGVYVGTKNGILFGSSDEGETWRTIAPSLPPILSVEAVVV